MRLRTVSVRVKWGKRKLKKILNKTVRSAFGYSFEVCRNANGLPITLILKLLVSSKKHEPYTLSLRITSRTTIRVAHRPDDPAYFYRIQWRTGKIRYTLKVCRLSMISQLLKLSSHFKVKHQFRYNHFCGKGVILLLYIRVSRQGSEEAHAF